MWSFLAATDQDSYGRSMHREPQFVIHEGAIEAGGLPEVRR